MIAPGAAVLDMGTGSGVCALAAARHARRVVAVDVSPAAARCTRLNAVLNQLEERIDIRIGDLFEPVAGERFDLVLFNPPFLIGAPKDDRDAAWRSEDTARRFAAGLAEPSHSGRHGLGAALVVRRRVPVVRVGAARERLPPRGLREAPLHQRDSDDRARDPVMNAQRRVLLINPRITSRRHTRFPLSIMTMAAAVGDRYDAALIDGNMDPDAARSACAQLGNEAFDAVGVTVMGGPQVATAIAVSQAVRRARPDVPIVWGGYFPTLYPDVALNSDYVDYVIRGQGEDTFRELLSALAARDRTALGGILGLSWRRDGAVVSNPKRALNHAHVEPTLRYDKLGDAKRYLVSTFLGRRTAAHQAALGCRFRCTFCGVAAMFGGATLLPAPDRLDRSLALLKHEIGADSLQFYDHNFFDREEDMVPLLEVLARHELPWWCYARSDALVNLSSESWRLVRKSRLKMAYIGAETPNDRLLKSIRKGTRSEQTLEVAELCRSNGVIPELSFMVGPPEDPEGDTERTFDFIRQVKRVNPDAEIIVYVHTPLPPEVVPNAERLKLAPLRDVHGEPVHFPTTPEEWTERRWVDYACHADAPWLSDRLRQRIRDFVTVLRCRFPTVQDTRVAAAGAKARYARSRRGDTHSVATIGRGSSKLRNG